MEIVFTMRVQNENNLNLETPKNKNNKKLDNPTLEFFNHNSNTSAKHNWRVANFTICTIANILNCTVFGYYRSFSIISYTEAGFCQWPSFLFCVSNLK